jgi:hypothetical protein
VRLRNSASFTPFKKLTKCDNRDITIFLNFVNWKNEQKSVKNEKKMGRPNKKLKSVKTEQKRKLSTKWKAGNAKRPRMFQILKYLFLYVVERSKIDRKPCFIHFPKKLFFDPGVILAKLKKLKNEIF